MDTSKIQNSCTRPPSQSISQIHIAQEWAPLWAIAGKLRQSTSRSPIPDPHPRNILKDGALQWANVVKLRPSNYHFLQSPFPIRGVFSKCALLKSTFANNCRKVTAIHFLLLPTPIPLPTGASKIHNFKNRHCHAQLLQSCRHSLPAPSRPCSPSQWCFKIQTSEEQAPSLATVVKLGPSASRSFSPPTRFQGDFKIHGLQK